MVPATGVEPVTYRLPYHFGFHRHLLECRRIADLRFVRGLDCVLSQYNKLSGLLLDQHPGARDEVIQPGSMPIILRDLPVQSLHLLYTH